VVGVGGGSIIGEIRAGGEGVAESSISSVAQFIKSVQNDYNSWHTNTYPWFRGEPESSEPLLPRLYREKNEDGNYKFDENQLVQMFRMKAPALIQDAVLPHRGDTDLWLFLMQHFRLPTRLLDWTEGALIALYFALQEKNPIVWMLDPCKLNSLSVGKDIGDNVFPLTWVGEGNIGKLNIDGAWTLDSSGIDMPVAVHPTNIHIRFSVQRSCFTVQGKMKNSLNECIVKKFGMKELNMILKKYTIAGNQSQKMLRELRMLGVSHTTTFPTMEGLSTELERSYYRVSESIREE
jgi:hypothetical protein